MEMKILKKFASGLNWLVSLIWAKEVVCLLIVMVLLLLGGVVCVAKNSAWSFDFCIWSDAFIRLFSVDRASGHWLTMVFFFVAWLVGGGALVSVMVGQYNKNINGGFRRWKFLVGNHVVVLGWDDGILMELVSELDSRNEDGSIKDCYIVTNQSVSELGKVLKSTGIKSFYIYKGVYDDNKEWSEYLKVANAKRIFIAGEKDEDAHDARVRILYDKVRQEVIGKAGMIRVNIHDFGLARKLIAKDPKTYENFHTNWAEALWDKLSLAEGLGQFDLYVIGFGAMGKAVALSAIQRYPPEIIYVSDDDKKKLAEERGRFVAQFKHLIGGIKFIGWKTALGQIEKLNGKPTVIVVAKKRSEKGMFCMMDILAQLGAPVAGNIKLALDQEVDGYNAESDIDMDIGNVKIQLFGMKKGC